MCESARPFEDLEPDEQARVFRNSSLRDKRDLILRCHHPEKITRALSHEELYLLTREMDLEEKSEVIRYATLAQLFFITDIECWKKDRLNPTGLLRWLETLEEADARKLLAWFLEMDYETIVAGLQEIIRVTKPEWEYAADETLGDMPSFTLDQFYYVHVKEENFQTLRRALEILFENHRGRYTAILEGVMEESSLEVEEEAYRKREIRLAELGFPDTESAHRIYRPMTQAEFESIPPKDTNGHSESSEGGDGGRLRSAIPVYPVLWSQDPLFLDRVLLLLNEDSPQTRYGIEEELVFLSNKIIASQGIDGVEERRIRFGVTRARSIVSLGLEILSGGDLHAAHDAICNYWIEHIFRLAVTRILDLHRAARKIVSDFWADHSQPFKQFLNPPYEFIFGGLLHPVLPLCYDEHASEDGSYLREFRSFDDLERMKRAVAQIQLIHDYLHQVHSGIFPLLYGQTGPAEPPRTLFSCLGTLFANHVLDGKQQVRSVGLDRFHEFREKAFDVFSSRRLLKSGVKQEFLQKHFKTGQRDLLLPLWGIVFQEIENELGRLPGPELPDSRYVSVIRFHGGKKGARRKTARPSRKKRVPR